MIGCQKWKEWGELYVANSSVMMSKCNFFYGALLLKKSVLIRFVWRKSCQALLSAYKSLKFFKAFKSPVRSHYHTFCSATPYHEEQGHVLASRNNLVYFSLV